MSLTKTLQQKTGNDASYWQIGNIELIPKSKTCIVHVKGYKDKAAFDAGFGEMGNYRVAITQQGLIDEGNSTWLPSAKSFLGETQALCKVLIEDLGDATEDDTDTI
jgi:hypothetical protein